MDLMTVLLYGGLPVVLLAATAGLSFAYNRLQTSHVQAERDRDSYLSVMEGSNDALFVIDYVDGRILHANQHAADLLGQERALFATMSVRDIHPPESIQASAIRIADAWEQQGLIDDTIPLLASDGTVIPVESSIKVSSYRGRPVVILFARDIRERLALQQAVEEERSLVREKNRELLAGIRYARRIQRAVLPDPEGLEAYFPDSFILFRPRDIVSGDLYWFAERDGSVLVAAADCTGHGVPGALLSLIGVSLFQEIVRERGITDPARVLDEARAGMVAALGRGDGSDTRDGMNVSLVAIDSQTRRLSYAGAYAPLYIIREGELIEHKGDRMPIGQHEGGIKPFQRTEVDLLPDDRVFLFSDGLQDQFGGPQGKKLRSAGLKEWLLSTAHLPMAEQHQAISDRFRMWKGGLEQVDDVLLIGLAIPS